MHVKLLLRIFVHCLVSMHLDRNQIVLPAADHHVCWVNVSILALGLHLPRAIVNICRVLCLADVATGPGLTGVALGIRRCSDGLHCPLHCRLLLQWFHICAKLLLASSVLLVGRVGEDSVLFSSIQEPRLIFDLTGVKECWGDLLVELLLIVLLARHRA
jgi:hypothetical protein